MALIRNISQVQQYVKVNFTNSEASLPNMAKAERRFIIPILGQTLYDTLNAYIDDVTPDADKEVLLDKVRSALAPLAYFIELSTIQAQITDSGVSTTHTDNVDAAHRWEYEEIKASLEEDGCFALEELLVYLFDNASTFSWVAPSEYKLIFKDGIDFKKYYPLSQPHRTFQSFRPVISQVIDQYIIPTLGQEFYEELRDTADPADEVLAAIELIKKAVANLTIMRAVAVLSVKIGAEGFTVAIGTKTEKPDQGQQHANDNQLSLLLSESQRTGESYLVRLKDYLNTKASVSLFATFFASDQYVDPATTVTDINDSSKGIFIF